MVIVVNPDDFGVVAANKAYLEKEGLSREDVVGKTCHEVTHRLPEPCSPPNCTCPLFETVKTGKTAIEEHVHFDNDGEKYYAEIMTAPLFDKDKKISRILRVSRDITERKRVEKELRTMVRQQAVIAAAGMRALEITDVSTLMDEIVIQVAETLNVEYCKVLELLSDGKALLLRAGVGWKEGSVRRATVGTESDSQAGYTLCSSGPVIVEDLRTETRFSGPQLLLEHGVISGMSVVIQGKKGPYGVIGAHTVRRRTFTGDDVSFLQSIANVLANAIERKNAEDALGKSEEVYRRLMETANDAIFVADAETGILLDANERAEEMTGLPAEQIIGMHFTELHPQEEVERYKKAFEDAVRKGRDTSSQEVYVCHRDGRRIPVEISGGVVELGGKKVVQGIFRDISERKQAERQIARQGTILNAINQVLMEALTCETEEEVGKTCLAVAEELTGSKFGFIGQINPKTGLFDTFAISNPGWDACMVPETKAVKLLKDMKIRGVDRATMRDEESRIVSDLDSHPDHVATPKGHPPLTAFLGVPLKHSGKTIGMIGLANKEGGYELADQHAVEALSAAFVEAFMHKRAQEERKQSLEKLRKSLGGDGSGAGAHG
ncbi:MAG: PAS domain S-box protein [Planctomycetota bacterium]|jgi:PAS domain S-box-containing protein